MSDDNRFKLTRRRALGGLVTAGAASAAAGAGTMALFSDTESSNNNTVQAGTLDLTPDGSAVGSFSVSEVAPGESGVETISLSNDGSIDGSLNFDVGTVTNDENGVVDPEPGSDTGAPGELGSVLDVRYGFDTTNAPYEPIDRTGDIEYNPNVALASSDSVDFLVEWVLPESAGNEVQSDGISVDFTFELLQNSAGRDVVLTDDSLYSQAQGFGGTFAPTTDRAHVGEGSWQAQSSGQEGLYFGGKFSGYHALPTFTVGDIAEVGYWMNHDNSQVSSDFFLQIFTAPKDDGTDLGGFYNARLTAVPPNANDGNPNWTPGQWNEFATNPGAQNQLYFYLEDNQSVSTEPRTLQDLQSGNSFSANGNTYGQPSDEIFAMGMLTNSAQSGFTGYLDDINLELTSGETLSIDLEP